MACWRTPSGKGATRRYRVAGRDELDGSDGKTQVSWCNVETSRVAARFTWWGMLQLAQRPALGFGVSCGRQSCLQSAFQAAVSIRNEFLGIRRWRRTPSRRNTSCRSSCARLRWAEAAPPKQYVQPAAERASARHLRPKKCTNSRVERRSTGQAEACPTKERRQECRRCRHECPRHVWTNGLLAQMACARQVCWTS
jgi:hypothetical protein